MAVQSRHPPQHPQLARKKRRRERRRGEKGDEGEEGVTPLLKSRDPHLAGGEKNRKATADRIPF